jgi:peptidylamidoglycolate lyase
MLIIPWQHRATLTGCLLVAAAVARGLPAADPNYPPTPTVIEYVVDPQWPKRPADMGRRAAVPGVAIDKHGRIWCVERSDVPVQIYSRAGDLVESWGQGQFKGVHSIRFDGDGNVWIADFQAHVVKKFTPEGELLMTLGTPDQAGEDESHFNRPTDIAITPAGDLFVSDGYGNRRVVHFDSQGKFVKAWGGYGSGKGQFVLPHMIVVDSRGTLYVADRNAGRIQLFNQEGKFLDQWTNLIMPWGLWISPQDELWVCGSSPQWWRRDGEYPPPKDQLFMRFDTDGKLQQLWSVPIGDSAEQVGTLNWVHSVAVDAQGNLYAGDIQGKRLQKFVRTETEVEPTDPAVPVSAARNR